MADNKLEETPAIAWLRERGIAFEAFHVVHEMIGKESLCEAFSRQLNAPVSHTLKTMVFDAATLPHPVVVVMLGDKKIDNKALAGVLGVPKAKLCESEKANSYTGYRFGGTSPFGMQRHADLRMFVEKGIADLSGEFIWVNGGSQTQVVKLKKQDFFTALPPHTLVTVSAQ